MGSKVSTSTASVEQRTIDFIPPAERHGRGRDLFTIWFGANLQFLTIVVGGLATLVFGLSFAWAVVALVLGNFVGGLFMALHAAQGPQLGVPQMIQTRAQFGVYGAAIVVVVVILMYVGFAAYNGALVGPAADALVGMDVDLAIVLGLVASLTLVALGYDFLHLAGRWVSVLGGAAIAIAFVYIFGVNDLPADFFSKNGFATAGFFSIVAIAAVWQIAYAPYVADYSRYLPEETGSRTAFWTSYLGCALGSVLAMVLGAAIGLASTEADVVSGIEALTGSASGFVLLAFILGLIAVNGLNVYCGTLATLNLIETFRRHWAPGPGARAVLATALAVVATLLAVVMSSADLQRVDNFLLLLLNVLTPWTAINLVDFYLVRHGSYDVASFYDPAGIYGRVNTMAIAAYLLGILVQIPFLSTALYTGPLTKELGGADVAWIVGLVVTAPVYYVLQKRAAVPIEEELGATAAADAVPVVR